MYDVCVCVCVMRVYMCVVCMCAVYCSCFCFPLSISFTSLAVEPVRISAEAWETKLGSFAEILEAWQDCQRRWLYVEHIFSSSDVADQMQEENQKFQVLDKVRFVS